MENKLIKIIPVLLFFCVFLFSIDIKAQKQSIEIPTDGTVNVYIVNGATRKFDIYNKEERVTNLKSGNYTIYNVKPGEHLFWTAENPANFLKGDFEANSTYVVAFEAQDSAMLFGVVGALTAGAKMTIFNPNDFRDKKRFYQVVKRFKKVNLDAVFLENDKEMVKEAMEKYHKFLNENEKRILIITPEMKFLDADKPVKN